MTSFLSKALLLIVGFWLLTFSVQAQQAPALGAFYDYNVLGFQRVTNSGSTVIRAGLASVENNITGQRPTVWGKFDEKTQAARSAHQAAVAAYNAAAGMTPTSTLTNAELGGSTYAPGVYLLNGNGTISSDITLDGGNSTSSTFIFIIKGNLTLSAGVDLGLIRDARIGNVIWVIEGALTVGNGSEIKGNFLARNTVTIGDGTIVRGRVASLNNEVKLNNSNFFLPTDLEIKVQKTDGNAGVDRYIVGQTITYTITVKNNGPVDDNNVKVTPIFFTGSNHSYTTTAPAGSSFSLVNGSWVWNIGNLKVGQSYTLTITATITETGPGFMKGIISGDAEDEIQLNNSVDVNFCSVLPDAGVITGPAELCVKMVGEYRVESVPGATGYTWNVPSGWKIVSGHGTSTIRVEATNRNDDAFIQVSVSNSCGASPPSRLKVNNYPDAPGKPGPITAKEGLCAGESATYSIEAVPNATNYIWTVPQGWKINSGNGTTQISVTVGGTAGKVTVKAENVCGVSPDASELEVKPFLQAPSQPSAITGSGTLAFCVTTDRITFSVTASSNVTEYVWTYPSQWTVIEGQGTNAITFNPNGVGGTVSVRGLNPCGQSPARSFTVVPVPGPPVNPGEITGAFPVCQNSAGTKYSIVPVPGATGYTWYVPDGWTITAGQGTHEITVTLSDNAKGGQIRVQAENACGASGVTRKDVTTTAAAPVAPLVIRGEEFGCTSKTTTYEIDPVPGAQNYNWTVPQGWVINSGQGTTRINVTIGDRSGNVTVTGSNSCGQGASKSFAVKPFPSVPASPIAIKGPNEVCKGQEKAVYSLEPVDHTLEYIWAVPSGWTILSGQGTTQITVKVGTQAGDLTVTASNPCGNSAPAKLRVNPVDDVPAPQAGPITGNAQYCAGLNQTYTISPVQGAKSYYWAFPGEDWVIVEGQGTTRVVVKAGATKGQVTVATVNNCDTRSKATGMTVESVGSVPPTPSAITSATESYCGNTTGLVFRINSVPTATSYEWTVPKGWTITEGEGTNQIKATAGTEGGEVTVRAINSCGQSQSIKLLTGPKRPLLNPEPIEGSKLACAGQTGAVYFIPAISGAETYLWTLPTGWTILEGEGTNRIKVKVGGKGVITVKARNACGTTAESKLDVDIATEAPLAPTTIKGMAYTCATRITTYSVAEIANASSYNWAVPTGWMIESGQGTSEITVRIGNTSGEVKVEAVNDCGKSIATTMAVTTRALPVISRIVDRTLACSEVSTFELESDSPGSTFTWELPAGWQILSGQGTSVITVLQGNEKGEVRVVADNGQCLSDPVSMLSDPGQREATLDVPNVFTPNNDGDNDTWVIGNLSNYPNNDLVVVNRWGNEVYKSKSYQNNWKGDRLAEGTYYYVLRLTLCDGSERVLKGYVMIVR